MKRLPAARAIAMTSIAAAVIVAAWQGPATTRAFPTELRVAAGAIDRQHTIVPVAFPVAPDIEGEYQLRDRQGAGISLQIDRHGRGWFVLPALAAGTERVYAIGRGAGVAGGMVIVSSSGSDLKVTAGSQQPAITYIGGAGQLPSNDIKPIFQRGGYLHPVRTPSGRIVTDDYPADHRHQHGIMFAWTSAELDGRHTDFWNMGSGLARVEAIAVDGTWSGLVHGGFTARHRYVDLTSGAPKPALSETWTTRVYAPWSDEPMYIFDVDVHQTPATTTPLMLPEYHYGGMAVRGAASFMGAPTNEIVLTSEGKDRASADNTRARWAHIAGTVDGAIAGIAMLGHPDNFRAPEPMRVHPTDPYICFVPSRLGRWSITTERPYVARYRFVAADGAADPALLDRLWRDFADPPKVRLK